MIIEFAFDHEKLEELNKLNQKPTSMGDIVTVSIPMDGHSPSIEDEILPSFVPFKEMVFDASGSFFVTVRVTDMVPVALYHPESDIGEDDGYFLPITKDWKVTLEKLEKENLEIMITGENLKATSHIFRDFVRFAPYMDIYLPDTDLEPNGLTFDYDSAKYFAFLSAQDFKSIVDYKEDKSDSQELDIQELVDSLLSPRTSSQTSIPIPTPSPIKSHSSPSIPSSSSPSVNFNPTLSTSNQTVVVNSHSEILKSMKRMDEYTIQDIDDDEFIEESLYFNRMNPTIRTENVPGTESDTVDLRVKDQEAVTEAAMKFNPLATANMFQSIRPFLIEPIKTNKSLLVMVILQILMASLSLTNQPEKGFKFFSPLLQSAPLIISGGDFYDFKDDFIQDSNKEIFFANLLKYSSVKETFKIDEINSPVFFQLDPEFQDKAILLFEKTDDGKRESFEISFKRTKMPSGKPAPALSDALMMNQTRSIHFEDEDSTLFKIYFMNLELEIFVPKGMKGAFKANMTSSLVPSNPEQIFDEEYDLDFFASRENVSVPKYTLRILEADHNTCKLLI